MFVITRHYEHCDYCWVRKIPSWGFFWFGEKQTLLPLLEIWVIVQSLVPRRSVSLGTTVRTTALVAHYVTELGRYVFFFAPATRVPHLEVL